MELPAHLPIGFLYCQFAPFFVEVLQVDRVPLLLRSTFKACQLLRKRPVESATHVRVP